VVAKRDLECGDIVTTFGGTTFLQAASDEGKEFGKLHQQMHQEKVPLQPLQYSFTYHLAEASNAKLWMIPELDKVYLKKTVSST
jgi:hypothetical protein